jgi:phosphomethylpyrimidine synthase
MKISEDVRRYARENGYDNEDEAIAQGMAEKSQEFLDSGAEVYTSGES